MGRVADQQYDTGQTTGALPAIGLGTWQNRDPAQCRKSIRTALDHGYRHVDTAQMYDNESAVGDGIERADIDRTDVFLATKVRPENLGYDDVIDSTKDSLRRLNTDYIDLLYVHWPAKAYDPEQTLKAFQKLKTEDVIRQIGVSNFEPRHLERAIEVLDDPPFANQVECHPLLPQEELRSTCSEFGVELVAYSPLARGDVFDIDTISTIADENGVSPAQVALAWLREIGVPAIPKASTEAHITDNWQSQSLELTPEQRDRIDDIDDRRRLVSPPWAPWN